MTGPSPAEVARTALARARCGTLLVRGCGGRAGAMTIVTVHTGADGRPRIAVEADSATAADLEGRRVASLIVPAARPYRRIELTGRLHACRPPGGQADGAGDAVFGLTPVQCLLGGHRGIAVAPEQLRAAAPDPLWRLAPQLVAHLREAHSRDLVACLRAQGHRTAEAVEVHDVDRYGISMTVLSAHGVEDVRLPFPGGPIDALAQAPSGIALPLGCRCTAAVPPTDRA
ncbi:DUF2470 domain-containing protein [Nocardioidaceae bacterium]|nr:DUF2470 domain-containing protein [Nocardioidaceae bacterium]